jgi:DNA replication protein DnaC
MPDPNCTICGGTGWRIVERAGLSGATRCECQSHDRPQTLLADAKIPPNYRNATLENFNVPQDNPVARTGLGTVLMQVRAFVREYPSAERPGLLLVGDPGTGKTHLAVAALKALIERGHEGVFFDYQNLLDRIRSSYDAASGGTNKEVYGAALDTELLLLDDLGAHRVTDWVEDTVTAIITHRCNHKKPLIATTNLPDPEITGPVAEYSGAGGISAYRKLLPEMIGSRARSRLFEMCRIVKMPGVEDYRIRRGR